MKRSWLLVILIVISALYLMGCSSPETKAQKMFNEGQYQQIITQFSNNPQLAGIVAQAKEKLADSLLSAGQYQAILDQYPETAAAKEAKNKIADGLLAQQKYQEILDKYSDTPAAIAARTELDKMKTETGKAAMQNKEKTDKAQAELDRIMKVRVPALRTKALKEFVANPAYAGTPAIAKAQAELNKK